MTPAERSETAQYLRAAASLLMGSELAYPKDMRDSIMRKVREAYLRWLAFQFQAEVRKHKAALKSSGAIPRFRISKDLSLALYNYHENGGGMYDLEKAVRRNEISDEDAMRIDKFIETGKASDLKGMNPQNLHFIISTLETIKDDSGLVMKVRKEAFRLMQKLADATGGGLSDKQIQYHEDMLKHATSILGAIKQHVPGKVTGPASKLATTKWQEEVDLSDLPSQYKDLTSTMKQMEVLVRVDKRVKKWAGSFSWHRMQLTVFIPTQLPGISPMRQINRNLAKIEETVEHELRHLVQSLLQYKYGGKAGTRFGPGEDLPGWDPKLRMKHVSKEAYPGASEKERYYLGPDEFYPNLETAVFRFKQAYDGVLRKPSKQDFEIWVGLKSPVDSFMRNYPFFMAYKRHDKPKYRKAVSEAWARLRRFVTKPLTISVSQLLRAPSGARVQTPKGSAYFTKQADGEWLMDDGVRSYDSKGLAQAIDGGDWVLSS
jgi:hypothetical protein